ncbi:MULTISPECIES: phosphotransferase [Paenibacillus]|uniref:phosphotransferase n=1 Tax=Paenibacillus TaxID=44249 RepID=UPI0022B91CC9|nr:phosphotransferase [Paenibacillus caseinilyticus]MCZ8522442.1 phosphotransferase [Paenibacillus caseinilyticus]
MSGATIADKLYELSDSLLESAVTSLTGVQGGTIASWTCHPIGSLEGNFVTDGVFRVEGWTEAANGSIPWSVIVKIIRCDPERDDAAHYNYWRREALVYQSGLLNALPGEVRTPVCYGVEEKHDGSVWLWLEDLQEDGAPWGETEFSFAACRLGQLQGAYLAGEALPDAPWLNRRWLRSWVSECRRYLSSPLRQTAGSVLMWHPGIQETLDRYSRFSQHIDDWVTKLERLPRTLSHQDFYQNNLMILRHSGRAGGWELAALDWQFASLSGIGEDLGRFYGLTMSQGHITPASFGRYRQLFIESYIEGLREAGWRGDERLAHLGFLASCAVRSVWEVPELIHKVSMQSIERHWVLGHEDEAIERLVHVTEEQMNLVRELQKLSEVL